MTSYKDIYEKALALIDSYTLTRAVNDSPITFYRIMYPFLQDTWGQIVQPMQLIPYLQYRKEPVYLIEDLVGDGVNKSFALSFDVEVNSLDNVYFNVVMDGARLIESIDYAFNKDNLTIDFVDTPNEYSKITVEYYYVGEIVGTSSPDVKVVLKDHATQLLASYVVKNWIEKQKNRELLIKSNLGAKEYQLFSPANALKENKDLYRLACQQVKNLEHELDWAQYYGKQKYGSAFNLFVETIRK